jgi:hypothetical protein
LKLIVAGKFQVAVGLIPAQTLVIVAARVDQVAHNFFNGPAFFGGVPFVGIGAGIQKRVKPLNDLFMLLIH